MKSTGSLPKIRLALGVLAAVAAGALASGCGNAASRLLRQGALPINGFPLYVSDGVTGTVWKYEEDRTRTAFVTGLNNPYGIATDRFKNLYIVERDSNRLLKVNTNTGAQTVVATGLALPSVVAVDSVGEVYVAQDTTHDVIRVADRRVISSSYNLPGGLVIGVNDRMIVGDTGANQVIWGVGGATVTFNQPVNVAIDGMGRVYVAEGLPTGARVLRYHQEGPTGETVVADALRGPQGIAVDPVGNIYVVEKGNLRITVISHDQVAYTFASGLIDPNYLAFTQY